MSLDVFHIHSRICEHHKAAFTLEKIKEKIMIFQRTANGQNLGLNFQWQRKVENVYLFKTVGDF